jgi:hypothetical protein
MRLCDYLILEYTNSELRTHGVPFIVILRFHLEDSSPLTGYVLHNWKSKTNLAVGCEVGDVEVLLEDLRHHSLTSAMADCAFFDRLNGLSVGPVRAFVSGFCHVEELDTVLPMLFDGAVEPSSWQDSFEIVGKDYSPARIDRPSATC